MKTKKGMTVLIAISSVILFAAAALAVTFILLFAGRIIDSKWLQNGVAVCAIVLLVALAFLVIGIYNYRQKPTKRSVRLTKNITRIALMTALSYILYMFVKFNLPFFPQWLDVQISEVPALISGFMIGPGAGCLVTLLKVLLKLPFSTTAMVGELGDFLIGIAFVLPSSLIYKLHKSKKGAIVGLSVGLISTVAVSALINWLILIPFYVQFMFTPAGQSIEVGWNTLLGMCRSLYPEITVDNFYFWYIVCAVLPFNLLRGAVSVTVTFLLYKSLSRIFGKMIPVSRK